MAKDVFPIYKDTIKRTGVAKKKNAFWFLSVTCACETNKNESSRSSILSEVIVDPVVHALSYRSEEK